MPTQLLTYRVGECIDRGVKIIALLSSREVGPIRVEGDLGDLPIPLYFQDDMSLCVVMDELRDAVRDLIGRVGLQSIGRIGISKGDVHVYEFTVCHMLLLRKVKIDVAWRYTGPDISIERTG
jgi:hypothetical protein